MHDHHPLASVIIPTWNGERFLANCLDSLRQQTTDYEVIVVNNGSTDSSVEVAQRYTEVTLVQNHTNLGFSRAVNQGLSIAQGDMLFLLNQDTLVLSNWLPPVYKHFEQSSTAGIVGCKLLYPDGRVQHAGAQLIEPQWYSKHVSEDTPDTPIDYVTGAAMVIRRSCYEAIGPFDEGFSPAYYEDVDYCMRAKAVGWTIEYEPQAVFTHFESQSRGSVTDQYINTHTQRLRLVLKHRPAEWVCDVFVPSEQENIDHQDDPRWLISMASCYLNAACSVNEIANWRAEFYKIRCPLTSLTLLVDGLLGLRRSSIMKVTRLRLGLGG